MSKESRKAARAARESRRAAGTSRPAGSGSGASGASGAADQGGPAAGSTGAPTSGTGSAASTTRRSGSTARVRAGRRERVRTYRQPSFFERYRTAIISVAVVAVAAIGIGWIFLGSTAAAYTCGQEFNPSPTPTVGPASSSRLGFLEDDMGRSHTVTVPQNYLYCPPASGNHLNASGLGPIQPRVYKPDDKVGPPNWIHNLEHGGMVVLYRNDSPGATAAGLAAFQQFFNSLPPSPVCKIPAGALSPVIARFDQMPHPYAAIVWGRVMYMDTWDPDLVNRFYLEESERLDANGELVAPPEQQCAAPSPSVAPGASARHVGRPERRAVRGAVGRSQHGAVPERQLIDRLPAAADEAAGGTGPAGTTVQAGAARGSRGVSAPHSGHARPGERPPPAPASS